MSLCVVVVLGASFVAQPTFIFGHEESSSQQHPNSTEADEVSSSLNENGADESNYFLGVMLTLSATLVCTISNILQSKCKHVPPPLFMLVGGFTCLGVGMTSPLFDIENSFMDWTFMDKPWQPVVAVSAFSVTAGLLVLVALQAADPVLISVVRSMEIVMALLLDIVFPSTSGPGLDFASRSFAYKVAGSAMVSLGVVGMAFSDAIYKRVEQAFPGLFFCHQKQRGGKYDLAEREDPDLCCKRDGKYNLANDDHQDDH